MLTTYVDDTVKLYGYINTVKSKLDRHSPAAQFLRIPSLGDCYLSRSLSRGVFVRVSIKHIESLQVLSTMSFAFTDFGFFHRILYNIK